MQHKNIDEALRDGLSIRCFRSGGGLRVFRMERGTDLVYYGESCDMPEALKVLQRNIEGGGKSYEETYGDGKTEVHYLTGGYPAKNDLVDQWVFQGYGFKADFFEGRVRLALKNEFVADLAPDAVQDRVFQGETIRWKYVGDQREYVSSPWRFSNDKGEVACSTNCVVGNDHRNHAVTHFIYAATFAEVMIKADQRLTDAKEYQINWIELK